MRTGLWRIALTMVLALASASDLAAQDVRPPLPPPPMAAPDLPALDLYFEGYTEDAIHAFRKEIAEAPTPEAALESRAWLAEALRRQGQRQESAAYLAEAVEQSRRVIDAEPCHARALLTLGETYNPQHTLEWGGVSADSAWHYIRRATDCDPDDGNAWMAVWVEALNRGERPLAETALRRMAETEFWTPSVLAYARWVLREVPENALVLTNGDADTVPMQILRHVEGLRPDVAVVNVPLIGMPGVVREAADRFDLPLPDSLNTFESRYDARGSVEVWPDRRWFTLSDHVLAFWLAESEAGRLQRPVVAAHTVVDSAIDTKATFRDFGAYRLAHAEPGAEVEAIRRSLDGIRGDDFSGPAASPQDRSPVRHSSGPFALGPLFEYATLALDFALSGSLDAATATLDEAEAFARGAGVPNTPAMDYVRREIATLAAETPTDR
ncbi:MAG: tetratricopeptide repeat protein [Bacteroidota bacterium]